MPRVLIAEDDLEIRRLVRRILEFDGMAVDEAENGGATIELIKSGLYDVILLDFMMPSISGFDVIDWIHENRPDIPPSRIVVMTAAIHRLKDFDAERVYAVIKKPFDVMELRDIVRACVAHHLAEPG